ncbi:helix-turn-helix domain-containing protein [Gardnerella piotii]|uniref:helix-turn-helix domain-containing protein n=1 Tax=Gardnerella TaxID=2701 RepID=UPI0039F12D0E
MPVISRFYKIKDVKACANMRLLVHFVNGIVKEYDVHNLLRKFPAFKALEDEKLFNKVVVDTGGYGIIWNDDLDVSCDELWNNGEQIKTPFDNLMSFADASDLWNLSESTLRKAVSYKKLVKGVDAQKYGKQWVVTRSAMVREYGNQVGA